MSTEIAKPAQSRERQIKKLELDLIRQTIAKDLNELEFKFFMSVCRNTGLNPLMRQIYPVKYQGRMVIQVGIDGFRLQAERSEKYVGQLGPFWCGEDGEWKDIWVSSNPPTASKVGILRSDFVDPSTGKIQPVWGIAKFTSFAKSFNGKLGEMWEKSGDNQIAKCAEAQGLRKAFPQETARLSIPEEQLTPEQIDRLASQNESEASVAKSNAKPQVQQPKAKTPDAPATPDAAPTQDDLLTKSTAYDPWKAKLSQEIIVSIMDMVNEMNWSSAQIKEKFEMYEKIGDEAAKESCQHDYRSFAKSQKLSAPVQK